MFSEIAEASAYSSSDILQSCLSNLERRSNVAIWKTDIRTVYENLAQLPDGQNPSISDLNHALVACVGGTFRSPRMARYLRQKGVELADEKAMRGCSVPDLANIICRSEITPGGLIKPTGFENPIRNVVLILDTENEQDEQAIIFCALHAVLKKQSESDAKIQLNLYVVEGDEETSAEMHQHYYAE